MRIIIDMQGLQNDSRLRGIGRYTRAFIKHLITAAKKHKIILVFSSAFPDVLSPLILEFGQIVGKDNIRIWQPVAPAAFAGKNNAARRIASELIREAFLASLQPDAVLVTSLFEGCGDDVVTSVGRFDERLPVAVILYDLIPFLYPDEYLGNDCLKEWYYEKIEHLKRANLLLAISESARNEALEILNFNSSDVVTVSSAVDSAFFQQKGTPASELCSQYSITQPYLLYTGASDPRKNLHRLVQAFASLPPDILNNHQLLLVGTMTKRDLASLCRLRKDLRIGKQKIIHLGHVSEADLIGLYRNARATVMPSYHEGFGLPVLESMACGTPVIGSNKSSIPEAIGLNEALFDPFSIESMAIAMERVISDEKYRQLLIAHGSAHCMKFSWERVAEKALAALESKFDPEINGYGNTAREDADAIQKRLINSLGQILAEYDAPRFDFIRTAASVTATFNLDGEK